VVQVNENYLKLKAGYLFPEIAKRVKIYSQSNKNAEIIKLGIGDVTEPLPRACIEAMGKALDDMGTTDGFRVMGLNKVILGLEKKYLSMILSLEDVKFHLKKSLFQMVLNAIVAIFWIFLAKIIQLL